MPLLKLPINLTFQIATVLLSDYTSGSPPPSPYTGALIPREGRIVALGTRLETYLSRFEERQR